MEVPECNVCNLPLDEDEHQPRHLGCSHDACTTCVKALIRNGFLECPLCRRVIKAKVPEDLPINHGVVQVLRLFKGFKKSENKQKEGATAKIKNICSIHEHIADTRCTTCKSWICIHCIEFHTPENGCEILNHKDFLIYAKKEHKEQVEPTLLTIRKDLKSLSTELSDTKSEKKMIEEKIENLQKAIEDGTKTLNKCVATNTNVDLANCPMELNEKVNISKEWHLFAQLWSKKNSDKSLDLLIEKLKPCQKLCTSMEIKGKMSSSRILFENKNIYIHCFRIIESNITKSFKIFPYYQVQSWLPLVRDLVFLDLAIAGEVLGRVTIRLRQDLPSYNKNISLLFNGEEGHSLLDLGCHECCADELALNVLSITKSMNKITQDIIVEYNALQGDVLAYWPDNKLKGLYIYNEQGPRSYPSSCDVIGKVESGLYIVHLCRDHSDQSQVTVADCGIVIKDDSLRRNTVTH